MSILLLTVSLYQVLNAGKNILKCVQVYKESGETKLSTFNNQAKSFL